MQYQLFYLAEDLLLRLVRAWLGWYRPDIWLAVSSALVSAMTQRPYPPTSEQNIGSISGLASQQTARRGNILGILGVASGILASLAAVGFSPEVLTQFGAVAGVGSVVGRFYLDRSIYCVSPHIYLGALIGRRITPTGLPQTVAALHSVVGLAAVLTSIGSVITDVADISTLHMVTAYLGVLIGRSFWMMHDLPDPDNCRRRHIYRVHCSVPEASRPHVIKAYYSSWATCDKFDIARHQFGHNGCIRFHGPRLSCYCGYVSWCKHGTQLSEGLHHDRGHWRGRYAYVPSFPQ